MEDNKKKIISIVSSILLLLILIGIFYLLFFSDVLAPTYKKQPESSQEEEQSSLPDGDNKDEGEEDKPEEIDYSSENKDFKDKKEWKENDFKKVASSFAERFGSYSSHSGFDNITDLKSFMSQDMREWANNFIEEKIEDKTQNNDYYGISTRAVVTEVSELDKSRGEAMVTVETQRTEKKDDAEKVFNQTIEVSFVQNGNEWKVNRSEWK